MGFGGPLEFCVTLFSLGLAGCPAILPLRQRGTVTAQRVRQSSNTQPAGAALAIARKVSLDEIGNADVIPLETLCGVNGQHLNNPLLGVGARHFKALSLVGKFEPLEERPEMRTVVI